jgi:outer membrane protein OmpA-like peptidoglycan-associated protein
MNAVIKTSILLVAAMLPSTGLFAQSSEPPAAPAPAASSPQPAAPAPLVVRFDLGSSTLRAQDNEVLSTASRAYNEGKPFVMILTGTADRVGSPRYNLTLSQRRATAVLKALIDRGIPAERFQILAKGETELPVPTEKGIAEAENRRVEITWR